MTRLAELSDQEVFLKIIECGSLTAVATSLSITPAAVSYRLTKLENRLGVRLLHRTTRRMVLTQDGIEYLDWARRLARDMRDAEEAISRRDQVPRGRLQVAVPSSFGRQVIAPLIPDYLACYPRVEVVLHLDDELVDIVDRGIDLAIRIMELMDSEMIFRVLAKDHRVLCASPDYLARHGVPHTADELQHHNCLRLIQQPHWTLQGPDGPIRMDVTGNFSCNNGEVLREMAIAGMGIALKATWDIQDALRDGRLRVVLPHYPVLSRASISAVYPSRSNVPAKVRSFIDFVGKRLDRQLPSFTTDAAILSPAR